MLTLILFFAQAASSVRLQKLPEEPKPAVEKMAPVEWTSIRRVYIDKFSGGTTGDHLREMLISSLQNSRIFVITEDLENADATLKGSAEADTFKDVHIASENAHLSRRGSQSNSMQTTGHFSTREQSSSSSDTSGGESNSSHIEERKHEASAAVRLVLKNGDVVWSTTQESLGAKFRGASADVADKIARQLASDWQRSKNGRHAEGVE